MNVIHVTGKVPLFGTVEIQGSKNAVLPILAATVLIKGKCVIRNCPEISDVDLMQKLLKSIGCKIHHSGKMIAVDASDIRDNRLPGEYVTGMRSSVMLMGAILSRTGEVALNYPGGCVIGDRPLDIHIEALKQLGARIYENDDKILAAANRLKGIPLTLRFPSVGATENVILAAVLAEGITFIHHAAKEPEIVALCQFLINAGAKIEGAGTDIIRITGVEELHPVDYTVSADRIVAGTYLFSTIAVGGEVILKNAPIEDMDAAIQTARLMGGLLQTEGRNLKILMKEAARPIALLTTEVYPGFPTDLQSVLLVALSQAEGNSRVLETIFNNRFHAAEELNRMGAKIAVKDNCAFIEGKSALHGRNVIASDLRGGAALIVAGLCATGDTFVSNISYIERGYEDICRDYRLLGASVRRRSEETEKKSWEEKNRKKKERQK